MYYSQREGEMWANHSDKTNKLTLKAPHWWQYSDTHKYVQFSTKTRATTAATSVPWKKRHLLITKVFFVTIRNITSKTNHCRQRLRKMFPDTETSAGSPTPACNNHTCTTSSPGTPVTFLPCKIDLFDILSAYKYDITLKQLLVTRKSSSIWQSNRFNKTTLFHWNVNFRWYVIQSELY